jgi:hypothetical protein
VLGVELDARLVAGRAVRRAGGVALQHRHDRAGVVGVLRPERAELDEVVEFSDRQTVRNAADLGRCVVRDRDVVLAAVRALDQLSSDRNVC